MAGNDTAFIDVNDLMNRLSVDELCRTAEAYFEKIENWDHLLAKPFANPTEAPELLIQFAQILHGLRLVPGLTVLDFAAGSGWSSRFLAQLGMKVISLDASKTALNMGRELLRRQPLIGQRFAPEFLEFDGHRMALTTGSVDRIMCLDAFHHVPNTLEVLSEMARVLKDGGVAAFSEPGPNHSKSAQSQYEMRNHSVVENDINIDEIWEHARQSGFTDLKIAVFNPHYFSIGLDQFHSYLKGGAENHLYASSTRNVMQDRRLFFLYKGAQRQPDSRQKNGLLASIEVKSKDHRLVNVSAFAADVLLRNIGTATWLPSTSEFGPVHLGVHLYDEQDNLLTLDYHRHVVSDNSAVEPGDACEIHVRIPSPGSGNYLLEFDLVSEGVTWFAIQGSQVVRKKIEVA